MQWDKSHIAILQMIAIKIAKDAKKYVIQRKLNFKDYRHFQTQF